MARRLLESGGYRLLESGGIRLLEPLGDTPDDTTTTQVGSGPKQDVHPETRAYWERERVRLAMLRDDDEVLALL